MGLAPAFATAFVGPGGRSCQPAVLDRPRALAQRDGSAAPAFAGCAEAGERNLVVLEAGHAAAPGGYFAGAGDSICDPKGNASAALSIFARRTPAR
jgi:hypothetical protein